MHECFFLSSDGFSELRNPKGSEELIDKLNRYQASAVRIASLRNGQNNGELDFDENINKGASINDVRARGGRG